MRKPDENSDELKEEQAENNTPKFEILLNEVFSGPMCFECLEEAESEEEADRKE